MCDILSFFITLNFSGSLLCMQWAWRPWQLEMQGFGRADQLSTGKFEAWLGPGISFNFGLISLTSHQIPVSPDSGFTSWWRLLQSRWLANCKVFFWTCKDMLWSTSCNRCVALSECSSSIWGHIQGASPQKYCPKAIVLSSARIWLPLSIRFRFAHYAEQTCIVRFGVRRKVREQS